MIEIMQQKKLFFITFIALIVLASSVFSISCAALSPQTTSADQEEIINEDNNDNEISEEVVSEVKGEDLTDYDNAVPGAEIKGAIPGFLCSNKDNFITVEIKNTSDFTWRTDSLNAVKISYHYYGQDVDSSEYDKNSRTFLPKNIEPGETFTADVLINDIKTPGNYVIQIDVVVEGKYWMSSKGVSMLESPSYIGECIN